MRRTESAPHVPVLIDALIAAVAPVRGTWLDGTMGAGGYARALLAAGAGRVIGVDRDPLAHEMAMRWGASYGDRLATRLANFADLDAVAKEAAPEGLAGVALDLGVSSMQIDQAERGFSFAKDGPLDMRMGGDGPSASDFVNEAAEDEIAFVLRAYGEERQARRIARAIVRARAEAPIATTLALAEVVASQLPRPKPGRSHPATRAFQAIRIHVNDEFGALVAGLEAAERALPEGGWLAVVTFHSLEDRVVKRFLAARADPGGPVSRHAPAVEGPDPSFRVTVKGVSPSEGELAVNPRARSARLRVARRTDAPPLPPVRRGLGLPGEGRR
ncbi:16S rRNA (cytosine1402-N4)-methyltransferase [Hasllibacter halocynthiae]|uniref:Ribosomal RNA small subunit methyltransferase H n=1 Tax=Hasllibacter halocynthiae TaxID=595589 RepID=A0A2T0X7A9_9RHOB|nr:16S rRNA (cytosine(1402)-N(4))-methyltransferase RsmH [Hasllibacter halocynthiae]PRY94819.1 16S rRNA (cytosine1402-N4)-methyltransferase [Hasllibacter halocynthiae]